MGEATETESFEETILDLVRRVEELLLRQASNPRQRLLVALAGVPGSGKSTVSNALIFALGRRNVEDVAVVPMDGFHYSKEALSTFDDVEEAFKRRGAPLTFDVNAFVDLVATLKSKSVTTNTELQVNNSAPSFDHATKDPVMDAIQVSSHTRLVILEGNCTSLDVEPWRDIAKACVERWFVDAPIAKVRDRIARRHLAAGIEPSLQAALRRAEENDVPNGAMIRAMLIRPDVTTEN